jgi:hypothetical protein
VPTLLRERLHEGHVPGASLDVFTMGNGGDDDTVGTIAIPVRDHINAATMTSWFMTDYTFLPNGANVSRFILQGNILTLQRNEAVQRMNGDWLLFIDDDMVWQPDVVGRLIASREEHDLDMVGALCFRRSDPYQPTLYMREEPTKGAYNFLETWDDDLVEVDATGLAFLLIHKRVFEAIAASPMPPLDQRVGGPPPNFFRWEGALGEDLRFCQDAKAAGMRIWVDTRIEVGHIGEHEIRRKQYLTELATRDQSIVDARKEVNDRMGLPTMTREAARKMLGWDE